MIFSALAVAFALYSQVWFNPVHFTAVRPIIRPIPTPPSVPTLKPSPTATATPKPSPTLTTAPSPTVVPTQAPKPTSMPTVIPTPVSTPVLTPNQNGSGQAQKPSPTSTPLPAAPVSNVTGNSFIDQINDYRRSQGLSPVRTDPYTCSFAKIRAEEIAGNFNHDGFNNRINSKTLPYPSYRYITENLAKNSNPQNVVNQWINSSGHAANLRGDTPYACVESNGNYYAYEGWKP